MPVIVGWSCFRAGFARFCIYAIVHCLYIAFFIASLLSVNFISHSTPCENVNYVGVMFKVLLHDWVDVITCTLHVTVLNILPIFNMVLVFNLITCIFIFLLHYDWEALACRLHVLVVNILLYLIRYLYSIWPFTCIFLVFSTVTLGAAFYFMYCGVSSLLR